MSLHKLSVGDGYTYLTKQVAATDSTELGATSLADYYSAKGEAPGMWMGAGLTAFETITLGDRVSEAQMKALFGEGRHPDAARLEAERTAALVAQYMSDGLPEHRAVAKGVKDALASTRLGAPFRVYDNTNPFRQEVAKRFTEHNLAAGNRWNAPVPDDVRARIRTAVGNEMFVDKYGREPLHEHELSGFIARQSRQATTAVAGYDLTFSPVKSVSALWAVAPTPIAAQVAAAHDRAVADALTFLETHAAYTRLGANGIRQVDVDGLIATAFTHRDSRAGDPDLHTHLVISNKVRTLDGHWYALDGTMIHKWAVAASETYNTRLETHLRATLGVRFADRTRLDGKRPIREIVGVSDELCRTWSSRRAAIDVRRGQLATQFQRDHGREPTPVEAIALAQQATLDTRDHKHEPRSEAEQRATWRAEARHVLGTDRAVATMLHTALHPGHAAPQHHPADDQWIENTADAIVATVAKTRATWQITHVRAEAERRARAADIDPACVDDVVSQLTAAALGPARSVPLGMPDRFDEPDMLRRTDGDSVYATAGSQLYTSDAMLAAEHRLVTAAGRTDGRVTSATAVEMALLEHTANNPDRQLNAGQIALVRAFATSGQRVQLALAPAGTGKTTAMNVFARAWESEGGTVIGLAPTGNASAVLREDIGTTCDTIDKLVHVLDHAEHAAATGQPAHVPTWVADINDRTVVVIDEAALAGTLTLDRAIGHILSRGASVKLIGDDRQLSSVAAGGVVRDIADTHGAITLTHVLRFTDPGEGAASIALRDGDPAAIGFYLDHGRIHAGDAATAEDLAYAAWKYDRDNSLDSVMMAPTRDIVTQLNERARTDRLATDPVAPQREIALADGSSVSVGDTIRTTRNTRRLMITSTDWVRNGYRWTVQEVRPDGTLVVTHLRTRRRITLPAEYVTEHVALGYAATIHTCQGVTADTSHTVFTGTETRNDAYVPLTRGRQSNHAYFASALPGDEHSVLTDKALNPESAVDLFTHILNRDGAQKSASTIGRTLADPRTRLAHAADAYTDALGSAAEHVLGAVEMARIDTEADTVHPGLTDCAAWPTLRKHLATIGIDGTDPVTALRSAAAKHELDSAEDPAAVLVWRLDPTAHHCDAAAPLPWLAAIPAALRADDTWGRYLEARSALVSSLAAQVSVDAQAWAPASAPLWARPLAGGADQVLLADLAVWRSALRVDDTDRRPTGPKRFAVAERSHQISLDTRGQAVLGDPNRAAAQWAPLAHRIDPRIVEDPFWPVLADKFSAIHRAGIDISTLARSVAATHPLPDELPAAALWWRLSQRLSPAVLDATYDHPGTAVRPRWEPSLDQALGQHAHRVIADAAWAGLVAAVDDAVDWSPEHLLTVAYELIRAGQNDDPIRPHELASALTWRIEALLNAPDTLDVPLPPEPVDEETITPEPDPDDPQPALPDAHEVGDDEDYALSLLTAEPHDPDAEYEPAPDRVLDPARVFAALDDPYAWIPAPKVLPYRDLSPDERVTQLQIERAVAAQHAAELHAAILAGSSRHADATAGTIAMMRTAHDAQRPYRHAALDTHELWLTADHAAVAAAETIACADRLTGPGEDEFATAVREQLATVTDGPTQDELIEMAEQLERLPSAETVTERADLIESAREDAHIAHESALAAQHVLDELAADIDKQLANPNTGDELKTRLASALETLRSVAPIEDNPSSFDSPATAARGHADACQHAATIAEQVHTLMGGPGGVVTLHDIVAVHNTADELDAAELRDAVATRVALDGDLFRAELAAARHHASATTAPEPPTDPDDRLSSGSAVAVLSPPATARRLQADPVMMHTDAELAAAAGSVRRDLRELQARSSIADQRSPTAAIDAVRTRHVDLQNRAAAATTAREAIDAAEALADRMRATEAEARRLRHHLDATRRRSTRKTLAEQIAATTALVNDLRAQAGTAQRVANTAKRAAHEAGAPAAQWNQIISRASNADALAAELAAAESTDSLRESRREDRNATLHSELAKLTAELTRRAHLNQSEREIEDRLRNHSSTGATRQATGPAGSPLADENNSRRRRPSLPVEPRQRRGPIRR